ncbi:MAG: hypothetical protein MJE66_06940, partial [Proteobacteria bacterium]|nr:hypothetical protein [Pseudomonadota bacterium]
FPGSSLLTGLRPAVEEQAFFVARARGTAEGYQAFLAEFGDGELAERARGNAAYLAANGFSGRVDALVRFAQAHPNSDYAVEARRSAETAARRNQTRIPVVALTVEVARGTPDADRLMRTFTERAAKRYRAAGVKLVQGRAGQQAGAVLRITHREERESSQVQDGQFMTPKVAARTTVVLTGAGDRPIWSREFVHRVNALASAESRSILFGATANLYWDEFFVPVSAWDTGAAARSLQPLERPVVGIDAREDRAVVLYEDGHFQLFELSNPESPALIAAYRRPRDLKKWAGVRLHGAQVLLYGPDGVEVVGAGESGLKALAVYPRDQVGTVVGVEAVGKDLVLVGKRGLQQASLAGGEVKVLLRSKEMSGLTRVGKTLLFTDGQTLFVSRLDLLRRKKVLKQFKFGRDFPPERLVSFGSTVAILGRAGVVTMDVRDPARPRIAARVRTADAGLVEDAAVIAGRLFLLGTRGLQVVDLRSQRIVDSVDVRLRERMSVMGRHLVAAGKEGFQVVDATPFLPRRAAAASP